jgi:ABC-type maltose transport system permease subunit
LPARSSSAPAPARVPGLLAVTAGYALSRMRFAGHRPLLWSEVAYASRLMTSDDKYTLASGMQTYIGRLETGWGDLAAVSILVTVPALVVCYVVQEYLVSGLTAGGTKG